MRSTVAAANARPKTSLRRKAMVLVLGATSTALVLVSGLFLAFQGFTTRDADAKSLYSLTEIIAFNVAASVTFEDKNPTMEILKSLKNHGHITHARAYMASLKVLATYPTDEPAEQEAPKVSLSDRVWFEDGRIRATKRIFTPEGRVVGLLFLERDQADQVTRLTSTATFLAIVLALVGSLVWILSRRWVLAMTNPLLDLAEVASRVSNSRDFSLRARQTPSEDELRVLAASFNGRFEPIQQQYRRV